jgi:hypothetical protein
MDAPLRDRSDLRSVDRENQVHDLGAALGTKAGHECSVGRADRRETRLAGGDHHGPVAGEPSELRGHRQSVERERLHVDEIGEPWLSMIVHGQEAFAAQIELDRRSRESAPDPPVVVREVPHAQEAVDRDRGETAPVRIQGHAADRPGAAALAGAGFLELLVAVVGAVERDRSPDRLPARTTSRPG